MKLYTTDSFELPLPAGHRFPMARYRLLRERLEQSGITDSAEFCLPPAATDEQLLRVHTEDWVRRVRSGELTADEIRRIGFPWSPQMVERSRRSAGATVAAACAALQDGVAVNLAGGTHHAFPDRGAGYCVFNDAATAIRDCLHHQRINRAAVIDLDVHQGDGTAVIFTGDASVTTLSVHAARAFPARKQQSDIDEALPPGTDDSGYLAGVTRALRLLSERPAPDIVIFLAGADPFEGDRLGGLRVTKAGLRRRDQLVFDFCLNTEAALVITMAGGYAEDIEDIVDIQFATVTRAAELFGSTRAGLHTDES